MEARIALVNLRQKAQPGTLQSLSWLKLVNHLSFLLVHRILFVMAVFQMGNQSLPSVMCNLCLFELTSSYLNHTN